MKYMTLLFACVVALALHNGVWAEDVYETTDAQGNAVFTDSPQQEDAKVIDLQQTNIVDAPPEQPQEQASQPQENARQQIQEETPLVIHDDGGYDDGYNDLEEGETRRQRALEEADPQAPHEVGDSENQMPHEVGDSLNQMPDEVGDFDAPRDVDAIGGGEPEDVERVPAHGNETHRR